MDFPPGNIPADTTGQNHIQILAHLLNGLKFINIQTDNSALSPVQLYKALLPQNGICLIYCMHIDADMIGHLTHRGQRIPLPYHICSDPHDDLIAKLDINRLVAVKINL